MQFQWVRMGLPTFRSSMKELVQIESPRLKPKRALVRGLKGLSVSVVNESQ